MDHPALFTTSWDDGHPLDLRLGDVLAKHGFPATFYVPLSNREGLPVMSAAQMRGLGGAYEIGAHTLDHCYLDTVDSAEARRQIVEGKNELEQILGCQVRGFCYPGGKFTGAHRRMVMASGYAYARTNVNFSSAAPGDPYRVPTTIQYFPHSRMVYFRNYVSKGDWPARQGLFAVAMRSADWVGRLRGMIDYVCLNGGVFHLWGHSWELDGFDGWRQLDSLLRYAGERIPRERRLTNLEVVHHAANRER